MEEEAHHKCEMECCAEGDCCETPANEQSTNTAITAEGCCEVHIQQAVQQDITIPLIIKTGDKLKYEILKTSLNSQISIKAAYSDLVTHTHKTSNIYLSVSSLRI